MKQATDTLTPELPGMPIHKRRGRPVTGNAKSAARRAAEYRAKKQQENKENSHKENVARAVLAEHFIRFCQKPKEKDLAELRGWLWALNTAGIISDEERENAYEWAFCVWKMNDFA